MPVETSTHALALFHSCTQSWFQQSFAGPTKVQQDAWPVITQRKSALLLAPTGSGKTLAAFLTAIDRLFFDSQSADRNSATARSKASNAGTRVVYISPLKALGVDVDRNLRAPIAGLRAFAEKQSIDYHLPTVAVRSGDTSQRDRTLINRQPPDILITTPESLYLMLTSRAESVLTNVDTVIVDEIHAMAGTKRGTHLFSTLERLERLRRISSAGSESSGQSLQRIGLSATQRPLEEIARLLGGGDATSNPSVPVHPRPVQIIDASEKRRFSVSIETPAEEQEAAANEEDGIPIGNAATAPSIPSVWPSIHPRLVELIRQNRSTMIFVNSRRLAERLATAINETAEEEIALAHHGSIARDIRTEIEDRLKRGDLPAMVATSSMELGIDMGSVDLVIQIEAPPSIASGTQRIGRAGHQVGALSTGIIFPKYRGDLAACSAATGAMLRGWVEETRYPRNPLDVLAQQIVAMTCRDSMHVDEIFATVRSAAPFFELPHSSFVNVLDLLSGRYPSDEFSELRPRINWDRIQGIVSPRKGAQRLAILNGGTIPDRGLYGVFLVGNDGETSGGRVGELDEEMVFECRPGDVFLLGASSWRVMDITRDRVLVAPAPGEPGRMPFWRGDGPGRPFEFGKAIGKLARELSKTTKRDAIQRLTTEHGLQETAAESLLKYLDEQKEAVEELPTDSTIIVESFLDEIGDWRIVILSPFGSRIHAPWALIVAARLRTEVSDEVDVMWTDDGIVFRIPESYDLPPEAVFFPEPEDVEDELIREIGGTALFAARFRENAARSLLLPRRSPQKRSPLWLQRRKSADLLKVAARFPSFPILIETYRECMQDVFDMPGFVSLLQDVNTRNVRVRSVRSEHPSPYAGAVLFNYVGNYIYDGDAPLAERRAQTLSLDHAQLRELLGTVDFRELFDAEIVRLVEDELQRISGYKLRHADDLHGLLLNLGPLTQQEIDLRCQPDDVASGDAAGWVHELVNAKRAFTLQMGDRKAVAVAEDASRLRDALGVMPPLGLPDAFLEPVQDAMTDLISQYARTHGPFTEATVAERFGLGVAPVVSVLNGLKDKNRVIDGEFIPGRSGREWCDSNVLKTIKRKTLAALRKEVEPVDPQALARFLPEWHGLTRPQTGLDGLLDVVEQLQGAPLPASTLEDDILPKRIRGFRTADLDELCVQGEVIWRGFDSTGSHDGRIGLFLTDQYQHLAPVAKPLEGELAESVRHLLNERGGLFFQQIADALKQFPNDLLTLLWDMVWMGEVTNDTLTPLRSLRRAARGRSRKGQRRRRSFRSRRRSSLPGSEGRWTLLPASQDGPTTTERQTAIAAQLVERHGVLTRDMLAREEVAGGFAGLYPVLKAMEESARVRRGYFVDGLGAAQFAAPGAEDRLRACRSEVQDDDEGQTWILAATDPANPWGNALNWPPSADPGQRPQRVALAQVIVNDGKLIGYLSRTRQSLLTFPEADASPDASICVVLAKAISQLTSSGEPVLLTRIDGQSAESSILLPELRAVGFRPTSQGLLLKGVSDAGR